MISESITMSILDAQRNMRDAYYSGAPGIVTSGTAWLVAAVISWVASPVAGITTLIIGGMFIFPASVLLCKIIGCSGKHDKNNPLAPLAIEGTIWMLVSIPIAIGAAMFKVEWFFPAMLLVIGGRYLTFATLYGMRIYWCFGAVLFTASVGLLFFDAPTFLGALSGALIEYAFGAAIFMTHKAPQTGHGLTTERGNHL